MNESGVLYLSTTRLSSTQGSWKQPGVGVADGFWVSWLAEKGAVTSSQASGHAGKDGEGLGWVLS